MIQPYIAAMALAACLAAGCSKKESKPLGPADQTYQTRGEVRELPSGAESTMLIQHEQIPTFVNRDGRTVGMEPMSMPFAVASGVELAGVEVGDKVEVRFEMRWKENPMILIVELRELPQDAQLSLGTDSAVIH